jgi:hypothetical protein
MATLVVIGARRTGSSSKGWDPRAFFQFRACGCLA